MKKKVSLLGLLERWVTTTHHTDIGVMYIVTALVIYAMHHLGILGMPRRIQDPPSRFLLDNRPSMVGTMTLGGCQLL